MKASNGLSESRRALLQRYVTGKIPAGDKPAAIARRTNSGPAPLSYGQQQIWLHSQIAESCLIYNEPVTIHYHGSLDRGALERSFTDIVRRHEAWRTTFAWMAGELMQIPGPAPETIEIPFHDLRLLAQSEREREALRLATEDAMQAFDLATGPLYRPRLVQLGDAEYRLFLTLHHIIFDGVSLYRVFLPELQKLYEGHVNNQPVSLRELPIQYADYAVWQRNVQPRIYPTQEAYWKNVFKEMPVLEFKTDHPRGTGHTFAGAMEILEIPLATSEALKRLAKDHSATLFMTVVAGFVALLHGYTGQEDIVIGSASSTRNQQETEDLLGFFLNTIVIRCAVSGALTFSDLLARVRQATLESLSNDAIPFELLVQKFAGKRDPSRGPLFQVLISVEPPLVPLRHGWGFTQMDVETGATKFDLHLELDDRAEGLIGRFIYNTALYEPASIRTLTERWLRLLDAVATQPTALVGDLIAAAGVTSYAVAPSAPNGGSKPSPSIPALNHCQMPPAEWKGAPRPYPANQGIHQIFEEKVALTPLAIAIDAGPVQISYESLNARANQLARRLRSIGSGTGDCVGVCIDRSAEFVVAILAILKSGGVYVPLDPSSPLERLAIMVQDAGISRVLVAGAAIPALTETTVTLVDLTTLACEAEDSSNLNFPAAGTDVASVMFTSGSTGKPKGAEIVHRGIARLVVNNDYAPFTSGDVVAFASNVCFDASTFEIWGALLNGGALAVTPREALLSPEALASHLEEHHITVLFLTTSLFHQMAALAPAMFAGLRCLVIGGEAADAQAVRDVLQAGKPARFVNGYGPTETTTFTVCHVIEQAEGSRVPIGRPIANAEAYVLDSALDPVPIGATGELYIGGPGVARGYVGEPQLTADSFLHTRHGRLYRTGDLAQWLPDGTIDFLGRADGQFKRRGFRIEPAEIEAQLRKHPAVAQCAVLGKTSPAGEKVPVAYLVRRPAHGSVADADFREYLVQHLPAPFVPYQWFWLEALPLTANGKLDHRALPEPTVEINPLREHVPPRNSVHSHLIEIWEEVLQRRPIGIRDDFFEVGGHSLLAAKVIALVTERLGHRLSFGEFFTNPTIESHALALSALRSSGRDTEAVAIHRAGKKTPVFFFHGDFVGGGFFCKTLANTIGADHPFYALHPHGLQGDDVPLTIEAMAADRLKFIREIQPHGPYILGGYCNGALTAFHAARLLRAAGEEVALLLMLNADGTNVRFRWRKRLAGLVSAWRGEDEAATQQRFLRIRQRLCDREDMSRFYRHAVADLLRHPSRKKAAPFLRKAGRLIGWRSASPSAPAPSAATEDAAMPRGPLTKPYADACGAYIPQNYDGPVVLLWPKEEKPRSSRGPAEGWDKVCRRYDIAEVPGHHHSCVSQNSNVVLVGEAMRKAIAAAESLLHTPSS